MLLLAIDLQAPLCRPIQRIAPPLDTTMSHTPCMSNSQFNRYIYLGSSLYMWIHQHLALHCKVQALRRHYAAPIQNTKQKATEWVAFYITYKYLRLEPTSVGVNLRVFDST